eukprot:Rmarinus@m.10632
MELSERTIDPFICEALSLLHDPSPETLQKLESMLVNVSKATAPQQLQRDTPPFHRAASSIPHHRSFPTEPSLGSRDAKRRTIVLDDTTLAPVKKQKSGRR